MGSIVSTLLASQADPESRTAGAGRLRVTAVGVFAISLGLWTWIAVQHPGFGFDYLAYDAAARRLVQGAALYDTHFDAAGEFGLYLYPPPFVLFVVPLTVLPPEVAAWAWAVVLLAALILGIGLMPVAARTRWLVLLLAGLSFPVVKAFLFGQVAPLLLLAFTLGWRWLDRGWVVGGMAAMGTLVKVQPVLLLVWAVVLRRWAALAAGIGTLGLAASAITALAGPAVWLTWLGLLARLSDPVRVHGNATLAAVLWQAGWPADTALLLYGLGVVAALAVWLGILLRRSAEASYMATVVVSQLASPIFWDHYAVLLLLPVAWLLNRGAQWAALIPLASPWVLGPILPRPIYLAAFWFTLLAVAWHGTDGRTGAAAVVVSHRSGGD
jgi:hypothetical protein